MDTILVIILLIVCSCIISSIIVITGVSGYYYKYYNSSGSWKCTLTNTQSYIVSRINRGNSECISEKDGVGCYSISGSGSNINEKKKSAEETCDKIIKNYPDVKLANKDLKMEIYTCGENSTNERLWGTTGYESKNDICSQILIKNNRPILDVLLK